MSLTTDRIYRLPERAPGVRYLTDPEFERLRALYPPLAVPSSSEHCPTCGGEKSFRWWDPTHSEIVTWECNCHQQWTTYLYLLHSNIGSFYQRLGWDDAVKLEQGARDVVSRYIRDLDKYLRAGASLLLHGNMGAGKTMVAVLLLKNILGRRSDIDGYFTTFAELVDYHTSSWRDREIKNWYIRRIHNAGMLVLDDVGRERQQGRFLRRDEPLDEKTGSGITKEVSSTSEASIDSVLRHRLANGMPLIVTTNRDLDDLQKSYGMNVMSLLVERSLHYQFKGDDFRPHSTSRMEDEVRLGLTRPVVLE